MKHSKVSYIHHDSLMIPGLSQNLCGKWISRLKYARLQRFRPNFISEHGTAQSLWSHYLSVLLDVIGYETRVVCGTSKGFLVRYRFALFGKRSPEKKIAKVTCKTSVYSHLRNFGCYKNKSNWMHSYPVGATKSTTHEQVTATNQKTAVHSYSTLILQARPLLGTEHRPGIWSATELVVPCHQALPAKAGPCT